MQNENEERKGQARASVVLFTLAVVFVGLMIAFGGRKPYEANRPPIPLVDAALIVPTTFRTSYVQMVRMKLDLSDFDCYACHEKSKPPTLRFDTNQNIIVPQEHSDIVMGHGQHGRNNNCFNCHDEKNLLVLQTRDGHEVKLENCPPLCGSCHGPTYRDWEAGAHGRTGGYWDRDLGELRRQICVDCHDPHHPKIPSLKPLPPPHPLRPATDATAAETPSREMKSEIRNPKSETNPKFKEEMSRTSELAPVLNFPIGPVEFVSDYGIREPSARVGRPRSDGSPIPLPLAPSPSDGEGEDGWGVDVRSYLTPWPPLHRMERGN